VSIFLAYLTPTGELYLIKDDNSAERFSGALRPWRENVSAEQIAQVLLMPMSQMSPGAYSFFSLVTADPVGLSSFDLFHFTRVLQNQ
jgi:hypothetical protein